MPFSLHQQMTSNVNYGIYVSISTPFDTLREKEIDEEPKSIDSAVMLICI